MIEAVLFDLDGTLVQYSASYADFMKKLAHQWGITDAEDPFYRAYAEAILAEGPVSFRASVEAALLSGGRAVPVDMAERCKAVVEDYARGIAVLPGAHRLLASYEGLPKAIVSNGPADMQRAAIAAANLGSYFDVIVVSGDADVAVRKPNAAIFEIACKRLGVAPEKALMIGDNQEADVEGARAAGLQAIHVSELY